MRSLPLRLITLNVICILAVNKNSDEMQQLVKKSISADKSIFWMLSHLKQSSGESLLEEICLYNNYLMNFTILVKHDTDAAQPYLDEFLTTGNPKFLEIEHSDFKMKFFMRWNDERLSTFHSLCVRAYNAWADLMFLHYNFTKFI